MQKNYKLVVDNFAEVNGLLRPWIDEEFWDFGAVTPEPGAVYMIGRQQLLDNRQKVMDMAQSGLYTVIFNNSAEGAWTLESQIKQLNKTKKKKCAIPLKDASTPILLAQAYLDWITYIINIKDIKEHLNLDEYTNKDIITLIDKNRVIYIYI